MNRNVFVKLRLKLFEAAVTPTVLFGLSTLPLASSQLKQLDAAQRRMLRSIAGWVRIADEPWEATMRRVNARLERALAEFPVQNWTRALPKRQFNLAARLATRPDAWPLKLATWDPATTNDAWYDYEPRRGPGRPRRKWDDALRNFCRNSFQSDQWENHAANREQWFAKERDFTSEFV